jgi:hypothetical protein
VTGLPGTEIGFQNLAEPFGFAILNGVPTSSVLAQPFSAEALKSLADGVSRTIGLSAGTAGQTRVDDRLWLWVDSGLISAEDLAKVPRVTGFAKGFFTTVRTWAFMTSIEGQLFGVTFYVWRAPGTSAEDFARLPATAGPVFASVLERLSFEPR